ncbi:GNAT family N-acetyltransferase [Propioniciclava sinopodophylli]|uniref:GNAT family N-acetyltransferase n=1 Tax=Propioniciclava sinopodophylli TaxID=1837344 RepID=UPI002490F2BF|nr:GNAT family N-acetyltransferase [Propioniciclava sinopodophylli]
MTQIHRVPTPPSRGAAPHPLTVAATAVDDAAMLAEYGHDDFAESARSRTVRLFGSDHGRLLLWVALPDGVDPEACRPEDALGMASVALMLQEDTDKAQVFITTHPDHRGRGVGRALLDALTPDLLGRGRTTWLAYAYTPGPSATGPDAIAARSGVGAVDGRRPAHRWLVQEGFTLEQCERPSTLTLDADTLRRAEALAEQARSAAPGASEYEMVGWSDRTPEEYLTDLGWLISRMSTDVPMAELDLDEQVWDAERVRGLEERTALGGIHWVITAARHVPTGRLTAFTRFEWPEENPAGVWQEETLVLAEHRGHRLGMLVKAANLARLVAVNPEARRAHTWNAVENDWMLAINDALGFVPVGLEGAWQKKF